MSTAQEIESAFEQLPSNQRWDLLHRLQERLWEDWDRQIESDYESGRLDALLSEVQEDISAGRVKLLHEVIDNQ